MATLPLANTLEGGSDGTTITTANSGGASGDAWTTVTIGASVAFVYSATSAMHGNLSMKTVQPATSAATYALWSGFGSLTTGVYHRQYFMFPVAPAATIGIHSFVNATNGNIGLIGITSTKHVAAYNAAGTAVTGGTGTATIAANTWYRLESFWVAGNPTGQVQWWLYQGDSLTVLDSISLITGQAFSSVIDGHRVGGGMTGSFTGSTSAITTYQDDIAVSTSGPIGPSSAAAAARRLALLGVG